MIGCVKLQKNLRNTLGTQINLLCIEATYIMLDIQVKSLCFLTLKVSLVHCWNFNLNVLPDSGFTFANIKFTLSNWITYEINVKNPYIQLIHDQTTPSSLLIICSLLLKALRNAQVYNKQNLGNIIEKHHSV